MKAKRLLFLVMAICLASGVKAQFYDGPDDIYFYVGCDDTGKLKEDGLVLIFNFDGEKACLWSMGPRYVREMLSKNSNYFEDATETSDYGLKHSTGNCYQEHGPIYSKDYAFTKNRDMLTLTHRVGGQLNKTYINTYKKVDKSFFKVGRSRTPSGTLHE